MMPSCIAALQVDQPLVDQGPHRELVNRPGIYRETWLIQSQHAGGL